jgi:antitoxin component of MazEF toxin-antitoxin module
MIRDAGLGDEVDIQLRNGAILIAPVKNPRAGWAEAASRMHDRQEDRLLDESTDTRFDKEEWTW